ncbi:hypothetical protein SAMN04488034_104214 [Salinimicrobium catena]|uniref:GLPGLI family protein n=1 Tax=Salinimicrobium catena TaxID=390640 RepID=A0A1H5NIR0_9FLAO|nr:hypothetical protein SAMN04488140_104214 [Salinimicrobium catena]SEF01340.1 hypothetical protein SAMN04488034_104214 [Salinimicrobium catena]
MKKNFLTLMLLLPFTLIAQNRNLGPKSNMFMNNLEDFALQKIDKVFTSEYSNNVSGKMYLFDEWQNCVVRTNLKEEGLNFTVPCNYNLYTDKFEMKIDGEKYFLKKEAVVEIIKGNRIFVPIDDEIKGEARNYMEILGTGEKYDLVNVYELKIKDVQSKRSLGLYEKKISTTDKMFFLDQKNQALIEVPRRKKKIYKLLDLSAQEKEEIDGNIKRTKNLIKAVELAG